MKNIIYNAQTGETTIIEVPDVEIPIIETPTETTLEEKVEQLSIAMLEAQNQLAASMEALDYLIMGGE